MIAWLKRFFDKLGTMLAQGAVIRGAGDTDEFDVVDHKTGEMTILGAFDELWPSSSDDAREHLLWITPYPFKGKDSLIECLREIRQKHGPNIGDAINGEMAEFDAQFKAYKESVKEQE